MKNKKIKQRKVVLDIEADALYNVQNIWCIVCKDIKTNELFSFYPRTPFINHEGFIDDFLDFVDSEVDYIIGHNIIGYDIPTIQHVFKEKWYFPFEKLIDTLVLSRLTRPVTPFDYEDFSKYKNIDTRVGGHSLEAWGKRLGYPKIEFNSFNSFSFAMLEYCVTDVNITHKIFNILMEELKGFSSLSIQIEHKVARLLKKQEDNGFKLDIDKALKLRKTVSSLKEELLAELQVQFPPIPKFDRNIKPKITKHGVVSKVTLNALERCDEHRLKPDGSYDLYYYEVFNPKSPKQVGERLQALGWIPTKLTPTGAPATDKKTLELAIASLENVHPSVKPLKHYTIVVNRLDKVTKWLELCNVHNDGRVHGRINPIGAATHRCSHYDDNMANIPSVKKDKDGNILYGLEGGFGWECRDCWTISSDDKVLVGVDAAGIQLRALAHYMNDADYTKALLEGDIHTVNQKAAGIRTRHNAKTFIYAFLLGAGDYKTGTIVEVTDEEIQPLLDWADNEEYFDSGLSLAYAFKKKLKKENIPFTPRNVALCVKGFKVKSQFLERTPALKRLKEKDIPAMVEKGFFLGLDGRKCWTPSEHLTLSIMLQSFEAIIMKYAMILYSQKLEKMGIPFMQVSFVHDEFQIEVNKEHAEIVGKVVADSITRAGELLKTKCPLAGEYKIGTSWATTH